jgi:hypothetical protein
MDAGQLERIKASLARMNSDLAPATASGYGAPFLPTTPTYPRPSTAFQASDGPRYHNFNKWPTMNIR